MQASQRINLSGLWSDTRLLNTTEAIPINCIPMSSSDGSEDLISPEAALLTSKIKSAILLPLIFLFGAPANVVNMIVFSKQGLKDRVNLCLFSLALVDCVSTCFCFLLYSEQMSMFHSPDSYGPVFAFFMNNKLMIFYNCSFGSMFLSTIISLERCFCILFPLHAKSLLKTKTMAVIVLIGVSFFSFLRMVVMAKYAVVCFFDRRRQLAFMGIYVTQYQARNKELLDFIDGIFYGFIVSVGFPMIVLISTFVTVLKLWQTVSWRKETSATSMKKEVAVTRMLVLLSVEFLIFALPNVVLRINPLFDLEFNATGKYRLYFLAWSNVAEVSVLLGMSLNFIVYYFGSSKYRGILHSLLGHSSRHITLSLKSSA